DEHPWRPDRDLRRTRGDSPRTKCGRSSSMRRTCPVVASFPGVSPLSIFRGIGPIFRSIRTEGDDGSMRRILIVLASLAAMLGLAAVALADSPHFTKGPTVTQGATSLTVTATVPGLGPGDY